MEEGHRRSARVRGVTTAEVAQREDGPDGSIRTSAHPQLHPRGKSSKKGPRSRLTGVTGAHVLIGGMVLVAAHVAYVPGREGAGEVGATS